MLNKEATSSSKVVGNVEPKVVGSSLAIETVAVVRLSDGHFPVLVELVVELGLSGDVLAEFNTVGEGRFLRENVLATSCDREGLSPELKRSAVGVVVLGLVSVGEVLLSVVDHATGTDNGLLGVVSEPVLVTLVLLDKGDSRLGNFLRVVFNSGTKVEVLLEVDVDIQLRLRVSESGNVLGRLGGVSFRVDVFPGGLNGEL